MAIKARKTNIDVTPGYNKKLIDFMQRIKPKEPINKKDVDALRQQWENYVCLCDAYDMKMSNMTAYYAMGISQQNVSQWGSNPQDPRYELISEVRQTMAMYREMMMLDNRVNPVVGIFWQKNFDGMKDNQERIDIKLNPLEGLRNQKELEQRYRPHEIVIEQHKDIIDAEYSKLDFENSKLEFVKSD